MNIQHELPREIITNTEDRSLVITPEIDAFIPGLTQAFDKVDQAFTGNPEEYLQTIVDSAFTFRSSEGADVPCSLLTKEGNRTDRVLVLLVPFSDSAPQSDASELYKYMLEGSGGGLRGLIKKEIAAPNALSQTIKSATDLELLAVLEEGIPVLTVFSPISPRAYSSDERRQIRQGDFGPVTRIVREAVAQAQVRLHGKTSETQIDTVDISGGSLGASNAAAAAAGLVQSGELDVRSVELKELIMGPRNLRDLAARFTVKQLVGEPSELEVGEGARIIHEPQLRQKIDQDGSELIGTNTRMIKGMKPTYMLGLTHPEKTAEYIRILGDHGVSTQVALAEHSALTHETPDHLPDNGEHIIIMRALKGQRLGHIVNEHVATSSLATAISVVQSSKR
jgi:hypothetical protein